MKLPLIADTIIVLGITFIAVTLALIIEEPYREERYRRRYEEDRRKHYITKPREDTNHDQP